MSADADREQAGAAPVAPRLARRLRAPHSRHGPGRLLPYNSWLTDQSIERTSPQGGANDGQHRTGSGSHLRRALELAEGGRGRVSPNPLVGAVLVRGGEVIGEGFHAELGGLHAERAAIEDCRARGEDPRRRDPLRDPRALRPHRPPAALHRGDPRGGDRPRRLRLRGPDREGLGSRSRHAPRRWRRGRARRRSPRRAPPRLLNQPFRKRARTGRPLVTYKAAMTLDGRVASPSGDSRWISSAESRELVHRWRAECDAVAVGIGTALADDPLLTARVEDGAEAARPGRLRLPGPPAARLRPGRLDRRGAADRRSAHQRRPRGRRNALEQAPAPR